MSGRRGASCDGPSVCEAIADGPHRLPYAAEMADPASSASESPSGGELVKVVVSLDHHWADVDAEVLWALPVGGDRFRLQNVPFYAYGLNFDDVVVAKPHPDAEFPVVERVAATGGHATFRVMPVEEVALERLLAALEQLESMGVGVERANATLMALDVPPSIDADDVFDQLEAFEADGILAFETCEERVEGRFGGSPEDD